VDYKPFPNVPRRNCLQETVEVPLLVHLLALPRGGRILEVGCGRAIALPVFARALRPRRLVGLDIDAGLLALGGARLSTKGISAELYCGDVRALPFHDEAFDLIIDFGTCHHIEGQDLALLEIQRVLSHGGLFVCETVTSQLLSHPLRTSGRRLPWTAVPQLRVVRDALLWKSRRKDSALAVWQGLVSSPPRPRGVPRAHGDQPVSVGQGPRAVRAPGLRCPQFNRKHVGQREGSPK